ncbi:undecaprenyldiphospho-muramoylpentapeptide beta-N-acetylglucosaminyltransferase [Abyssalbus ytuae]|uniref:UDP-N-acetylglucosamine--N-acetylmuramyl-(pentapeptide) pyrophosphoryl-undecaprenol N-acetylglucosamine transferase n=1 Tax=Abyssalbus ytuae TaxID=2926907 RepID=A0A9E7CTQ9_9FLAO|nr:undecaprenyldiphospho-muramoylpentapeptide beta-N-acetylglucosaminyltransferase [Abyssalbus ytuae]UOB18491.1 undecaprenyldiphospho-muramoylpentapeptide beta-N-acetylglucosaminyltransferase [Abyssalbus ytuae]
MSNYKFILSGGGTGGHIYPAISIANELKSRFPEAQFLFVGAKDRMEMEKVPEAGYEIKGLWISGIQRRLSLKNFVFPFKLIDSFLKAGKIVKQFKPTMVIGTGGYASAPLVKVASAKGVKCVIQEQNSYPGIANKFLAGKAEKIFVAYDGLERFFPKNKIIKTGNPVRQDILNVSANVEEALEYFQLNKNKKVLLVLGGSLGARAINKLIEKELNFFAENNIQVIWQCGKLYYEEYKKYENKNIKVLAFLNKMNLAYTAADVIISRAGAGTVSELCIVGKPVIFIPSPNVAEDHQTKNAKALSGRNAAVLVKEVSLDSRFEKEFKSIITSETRQKELSKNIKKLALPHATKHIVDEIEKILKTL